MQKSEIFSIFFVKYEYCIFKINVLEYRCPQERGKKQNILKKSKLGRLIIMGFKKVVATVLATVTALSSMAVVSAGAAYEWSATSDKKLGKYITGDYCRSAANFKSVARAKGVKYDNLSLAKNDQTTVRYTSNDNTIKWKVQAGSYDNKGVYCDVMKNDKGGVWAPQFNTVEVMSLVTDWNGKSKRQVVKNGYSTQAKSSISVDWFQSKKQGCFYAKYTTKNFYLNGNISK